MDKIAKQQLNVIILVDTSKSMQGKRISQVNMALRDIKTHLTEMQDENANVEFCITVIPFSNDGLRFLMRLANAGLQWEKIIIEYSSML